MKKRLPTINCCTPLAGSSLAESEAIELERLFRVLADRNRLKILNILLRARGEAVCVCEFTDSQQKCASQGVCMRHSA